MEFTFRVGLHLEVRQSIDYVKRDNATVIGRDALAATDAHRTIDNLVAVGFDLAGGVCCVVEAVIGTLTKDEDSGSSVGLGESGCVDQLECVEFVVIDSGNVNFTRVDMENNGIVAYDPAVSTAVHERSSLTAGVGADIVSNDRGIIGSGGGM